MTASEVVSHLLPLGLIAAAGDSSTFGRERETFGEFFRRVSDELLWPRILVRIPPAAREPRNRA